MNRIPKLIVIVFLIGSCAAVSVAASSTGKMAAPPPTTKANTTTTTTTTNPAGGSPFGVGSGAAFLNGNNTSTNGTSNLSGNSTNATNGTGSGWHYTGIHAGVPGPWDYTKGMITGAVADMAKKGAGPFIKRFNRVMLTYSVPGKPWHPTTWDPPTNKLSKHSYWRAVKPLYRGLEMFVLVLLFAGGLYSYSNSSSNAVERQKASRKFFRAVIMIIFGLPICIPFAIHTSNQVTLMFAPNTADFFATPGNTAKLGLGVIFGGGVLAVDAGVVVIAVIARIGLNLAVSFLAAAWPALWAATVVPNKTVKSFGERCLISFAVLMLIGPVQGFGLRFLFWLPLDFSVTSIMSVLATIIGLGALFIVFPKRTIQNIVPDSVTIMSSDAKDAATQSAPGQFVLRQYNATSQGVRNRVVPNRFQSNPDRDPKQRSLSDYQPSFRNRVRKRIRR